MILHELKRQAGTAEPVTGEFVALMDATFRPYTDLRNAFFGKLPDHLHQSELISFINVEIKARLFDEAFCTRVPDALKSLRRALIRLEDLREADGGAVPATVNDLATLADLGERIEALYQKHWEHYRYQDRLTEDDVVAFILEIDRIGYAWDLYLTGYAAANGLIAGLSGQDCPQGMEPLDITYQREAPFHFAVGTLKAVMDFLESAYRFVATVSEVDAEARPLTLLQAEVAEPVRLRLGVPTEAAPGYRRLLQYLFLRDMLKREALLKVVFEATSKDAGREKPLSPTALTNFQKDIGAQLKRLPEDGRFSISDRTFPDDRIQVLQEFTAHLDANSIGYDMLLRGTEGRTPRKRKAKADSPPAANGEAAAGKAAAAPAEPRTGEEENLFSAGRREHIAVLTERERREANNEGR